MLDRLNVDPGRMLGLLAGQAGAVGVDLSGVGPVLELAAGADRLGPLPAPDYLRPLFERVGDRNELPPALLAAMAGALTDYDPNHMGAFSSGLLAFPMERLGGRDVHAERVTRRALADQEPGAVAALVSHAERAAALLAELSGGSLADGLEAYCRMVGGGTRQLGRELSGRVVGAYVLALARGVGRERWDQLGEALP